MLFGTSSYARMRRKKKKRRPPPPTPSAPPSPEFLERQRKEAELQAARLARAERMAELEELLVRTCGVCTSRLSSSCPRSRVDVNRMVRINPTTEAPACDDRFKPNEEWKELDSEYVFLKLHQGL